MAVQGKKDVENLKTLKEINLELNKQRSLRDKNAASQETEKDRVKYILSLEKQRKAITADINAETNSLISLNKTINTLKKEAQKAEDATNKSLISRISALAKGNFQQGLGLDKSREFLEANRDLKKEVQEVAEFYKEHGNNLHLANSEQKGLATLAKDIGEGLVDDNDQLKDRINQLGIEKDIQGDIENRMGSILVNQKKTSALGKTSAARAANFAKALGVAGAAFALVKSIAEKFAGIQDAIGKEFGSLVSLTDGVQKNILKSNVQASKLGASVEDVVNATSTLSGEFGVGTTEAAKLAGQTIDTSKAIGLSVEETGKLIGTLMTTSGLSFDQAERLAEGANQLANMNNVNPSAVLKDMASSAEEFASFSQDGGDNLARAAVQARAMGISLQTTAKVSEGLLNFQDSITKEINASVLIGRQLNLQKARELALSNDIEGAMREVVKQVGTESEFNRLNSIQRKALADSIGVSVADMAKLVANQDKLNVAAGASAKSFRDLLGKEGLSNLTQLTNELKTFGVIITNVLGPPLMLIVKGLNQIFTLGGLLNFGQMDDGVVGPGGISMMAGSAGVFKLNPRDSVMATTNPIPVNDIVKTGAAGAFGQGFDLSAFLQKFNFSARVRGRDLVFLSDRPNAGSDAGYEALV